MRRKCFAVSVGVLVAAAPAQAWAQRVPGRELLGFGVGAVGEAPALAAQTAGGLYNPAAPLLGPAGRVRGSVAQLNAPGERGITGQVAALDWRVRPRTALSLAIARAGVADIQRTESDPTQLGEVLYDVLLVSGGAARRVQRHVVVGAAARYRYGRLDTLRAGAFGADAGVVVDGLLGRRDLRVGVSSFLWSPSADARDRPVAAGALDLRVAGMRADREARLGLALQAADGDERERFAYLAGRWSFVEARAGVAQGTLTGAPAQTRVRFGIGLRYARVQVGVAREESDPTSLGPIYQLTLSSVLR